MVSRASLAAVALVLAVAAPAGAAWTSRPVLLGGTTPPGCGTPPGAQLGAEAEPHLAIDPADPRHLALSWQQDRNRNGGATALAVRLSEDGGRSWVEAGVTGLTGCPLAFGTRASDPWLSFGAAGRLWVASVPGSNDPGPLPTTRVAVASSPGRGQPFGAPAFADAGPAFNDKETLTADPARPGEAHSVWTIGTTSGWYARTSDAGATWSAPVRIARGTGPQPALGLILHVVPGGGLVAIYGKGPLEGGAFAVRSTDGGATWSAPRTISRASRNGADDPAGVRSSAWLPQVGARGRRIAVATTQVRRHAIRLAESRDGGRTWSRTRDVVRGPGTPFLPAVARHANGTLALTTYHLVTGRRAEVRLHLRSPGGRWRNQRLASFSLTRAPRAGSNRFLADYTGLVATPGGFVAAYPVAGARARSGPSDVEVVRIALRG